MFRKILLALTFAYFGTKSFPILADTVVPALTTTPSYFVPSDTNYGVDLGCFASDQAAADAYVALAGSAAYGKCNAAFSGWTSSWPNGTGITSYYHRCPPPNDIPFWWGYQHMETRNLEYTYNPRVISGGQPLCLSGTVVTDGGIVAKQVHYYCADADNFELFQSGGTPNIALCRLKAGKADPAKQPRTDCCNVGNPINLGAGVKYQREIDYLGAGAFPLRFERHYWKGGWTHNYNRSVQFTPVNATYNFAAVTRSDGQRLTFKLQNGVYKSDADVVTQLVRLYSGGQPDGWQYKDLDDSVEIYDVNGKLISATLRSGLTQNLTYNGSGQLAAVTDNFGHQLSFTYDTNGRLATVTDPAGQIYSYGYDASSNLSSVTYPGNQIRTYLYNEPAYTSGASLPYALTGIIDETNQRYATFSYDAQGRAIQTEHSGGANRVTVAYNANGTRSVTDALGTTRTFTLISSNNINRLSAVSGTGCDGCGLSASYAYDTNGFLNSITDFRGNVTTFYAGDTARILETQRIEARYTSVARITNRTWHSSFRLPATIDEPNRSTSFTHDSSGNVLTKTVTDTGVTPNVSRTWTYTYDSYGRVLTEDGPRTDVSDVTTFTYYSCATGSACGQLQTITNAQNQRTTYDTYNAHGQPLTITDPNGVVATLTYDARQRLTSRTVGGETTSLDYWPTGLLKKVTLPDFSYLLYTYDAAHRLIKIEDGEGNRIDYTLDAAGNRTAESAYDPTNVLARTHTRVINSLNRLWKEIGAAGTTAVTTEFSYDNNGNQTAVNAPLLRNSTSAYDELNRLTQSTDPASGVTQFGYDPNDNLTDVTDPRNLVTSYQYNGFGDLKQQTSPDTGTTVNTYDSGGNLKTSTDARGAITTYTYDTLNRVTSAAFKIGSTTDQTIAYTYDAGTNGKGRLTGASDANHALAWTYDAQGRVIGKGQTVGTVTKSVGYSYTNGLLSSMVTPSGQNVTYGYSNGRVSSISINGTTLLSNVLYEPFGPVRQWTWGNGTLTVRGYDQDGRIAQLDSKEFYTYTSDDAGRITAITNTGNNALSWAYGYDLMDRLTSASKTGTNFAWTHDADGNRLTQTGPETQTLTYPTTSNRLSSVTGTRNLTYTYDAAGNLLGDGTRTYAYNNRGRMKSATDGTTVNYIYDALGQRIRKSGTVRIFMYDEDGHLLGEYTSTGSLVQETIWLGDIPVATLRPATVGVDIFYVHTDHLNTPRKVTRPSDNKLRWWWEPYPFGGGTKSENPEGLGTFVYQVRFPGQYFDAESGLYYNYFRDYDWIAGRYVQSDPIGLKSGINTYGYVFQNPLAYSDPKGLAVHQDNDNYCWEGVGIKCVNKKLPPTDKLPPTGPQDPRDRAKKKVDPDYCAKTQPEALSCVNCCRYLAVRLGPQWQGQCNAECTDLMQCLPNQPIDYNSNPPISYDAY